MILHRIHGKIVSEVAPHTSEIRHKWFRKKLKNTDMSIISQNCIGCVMSHDLGLQYLSPTVNLYMTSEDFMTFVEHLKEFENAPLTFIASEEDYPVAICSCGAWQVKLFFVHYHSEKEAEEKWHERFRRINYDNIGVVMTDRDGFNDSILKRFEALPYKKLLFTARQLNVPGAVFIKEYAGEEQVDNLIPFANIFGRRKFETISIVDWMNA